MKADDVVASINRLADPKNGSNALSAFTGYLGAGGAKKVDDATVEFHLDAANGNFPYLLSSDNYNAIIIPADYKGDFEKTMIGTGPFKLESYTPKVGAAFVRNPDYWGGPVPLERVEVTFYTDYQPQILALQAGELDVMQQAPVLQSVGILNDPNINVISLPSIAHQQVHMRTDKAPFTDARVRRAIALCLDRDALVKGLMKGRAQKGNDSPFAAAFPSTDQSVPQREKNIAEAKQLMEAAGLKGFEVTLTTENYLEIPAYAQVIQNAVKESAVTSSSTSSTRAPITGMLSTASRSGWIPTWASPITAIAACRTSSCRRRCAATAPGTRRISRTRNTTSWSRPTSPRWISRRRRRTRARSRSCSWTRPRSSSATSTTS